MKLSWIFILFFVSQLYSQDFIHVEYDLKDSRSLIKESIKAELFATPMESIFYIFDKILDRKTLYINEEGQIVGDTIDNVSEIYKNFNQNKIFSNANFVNLYDKIQYDDVNTFKWKKIDEVKFILGYKCKKAILNFRGRTYEAYYCPELKLKDGPYKFCGLPGLILNLKEKNNRIEYLATSIDFESFELLKPGIDIKNAISWDGLNSRAKLKFWNAQQDISNPVNYYSDEIEIYDLNNDPLVEILYDVYSEFSYMQNEKLTTEKTLNSLFKLSCDFTESNYNYIEQINNNQNLREFGRIKRNGSLYKNLLDNIYLNEMEVEGIKIIVQDQLLKINWKIHEEFDNILGFKTQKATLEKPEYSIEVWFTNIIKISNGPNQLHGLPGIILKSVVKHKNVDQIDYTIAKSVKIKNKKFNPYIPKKKKRTKIFNEKQLNDFLQSIQW